MRQETRLWLRNLEQLGENARKLVHDGSDPLSAVKKMAHEACEPRDEVNFAGLCADLHIVPRMGGAAEGFAAEVEVFVFAYNCLTRDVFSDAA